MTKQPECARCNSMGWVCENHDTVPWGDEIECECGGAGMPCPSCNPSDYDHPPRELAGSTLICGWVDGFDNAVH